MGRGSLRLARAGKTSLNHDDEPICLVIVHFVSLNAKNGLSGRPPGRRLTRPGFSPRPAKDAIAGVP